MYLNLKEYYQTKKDFKKAIEYFDKYKTLNDSINNEENIKKLSDVDKIFEINNKENQISLLEKEKEIALKKNRLKTIFQYISILGMILAALVRLLCTEI